MQRAATAIAVVLGLLPTTVLYFVALLLSPEWFRDVFAHPQGDRFGLVEIEVTFLVVLAAGTVALPALWYLLGLRCFLRGHSRPAPLAIGAASIGVPACFWILALLWGEGAELAICYLFGAPVLAFLMEVALRLLEHRRREVAHKR